MENILFRKRNLNRLSTLFQQQLDEALLLEQQQVEQEEQQEQQQKQLSRVATQGSEELQHQQHQLLQVFCAERTFKSSIISPNNNNNNSGTIGAIHLRAIVSRRPLRPGQDLHINGTQYNNIIF